PGPRPARAGPPAAEDVRLPPAPAAVGLRPRDALVGAVASTAAGPDRPRRARLRDGPAARGPAAAPGRRGVGVQPRRPGAGPARARIALVSGGSWAAARVERTAVALAASGAAVPVTLCGRDDALRQRLTRLGAGVALGWTDDVASVMAAADVLVDDAGGLTCA